MSEPLVVTIPHRLGKDEAARRIRDGVARAKSEFATCCASTTTPGRATATAFRPPRSASTRRGRSRSMRARVRLTVTLPWLLARFARAVQRVVGQRGQLMLEKK